MRLTERRPAPALWAWALIALALASWGIADRADAASGRYCSPIVSRVGPGLTKADVTVVSGTIDCEKSRKIIFKALSTAPYKQREINGFTCKSTGAGGSGVHGARCVGGGGSEVIRSGRPRHCGDCHGIKD